MKKEKPNQVASLKCNLDQGVLLSSAAGLGRCSALRAFMNDLHIIEIAVSIMLLIPEPR